MNIRFEVYLLAAMLFFPTDDCAMDHVVSRPPLIAKARVQSLAGRVVFMVHKTSLDQVFLRVLLVYPVISVQPVFI